MARYKLPPGPGRPKGVPNKLSRSAKEITEMVYAAMQDGRGPYDFLRWAKENPGEFYTKLWAKLIPADLNVKGNMGNITLQVVTGVPLRPDEIEADRRKAEQLTRSMTIENPNIKDAEFVDLGEDLC